MKTSKILILMTVIAFAMASLAANADGVKSNTLKNEKVVNMNLSQAYQIPGLVIVMHRQLDGDFLKVNQKSYTVEVFYMHYTFRISGTYDQWVLFFYPKWLSKGTTASNSEYRDR